MEYAPICIFTYKRLEHLQEVINALRVNYLAGESELYVCSNAPINNEESEVVNSVIKYASNIAGFKKTIHIKNQVNKGGSEHAIKNISNILKIHKKIIVLNDDNVPTKNFLNYMNEALIYYENNEKIFSVGAFSLPLLNIDKLCDKDVYFLPRMCTWGWGIWADRWMNIKWDLAEADIRKCSWFGINVGGNDKFNLCINHVNGDARLDVLCIYTEYINKMLTVYPKYGFITDIGLDGTGTNCGVTDKYLPLLIYNEKINFTFTDHTVINKKILRRFEKHWGNFFIFILLIIFLPLYICLVK
jgi:hypothetical protein